MAEQESQQKEGFKPYEPLKLNNNVWFSPYNSGEKSSLSLNYQRDGLILDFSRQNPDGNVDKISKKIEKNKIEILNKLLLKLCGDRINLLTHLKEGAPNYNETTLEAGLKINNMFYSKKDNGMIDSGAIAIHTVKLGNFNRAAISAMDITNNKRITVVLADSNGERVLEQKDKYVIDAVDAPLYNLQAQIGEAAKFSWNYAGFDKLYQMLKLLIERGGGGEKKNFGNNNYQNKKPFFQKSFPWKKNDNQQQNNYQNSARQAEIKDTSSTTEDGADLFNDF